MALVLDDVDVHAEIRISDALPIDLIRSAIAVQLRTVSSIGQVHEYEPFMAQARSLREYMGVGVGHAQRIHGWTITRARTPEVRDTQRQNNRFYHYHIRGYYGVTDQGATELRFQRLIEAVCNAFRDQETDWELSGVCEYIEPPQVLRVDHVMLVGVLCHYVEILIVARTQIDW